MQQPPPPAHQGRGLGDRLDDAGLVVGQHQGDPRAGRRPSFQAVRRRSGRSRDRPRLRAITSRTSIPAGRWQLAARRLITCSMALRMIRPAPAPGALSITRPNWPQPRREVARTRGAGSEAPTRGESDLTPSPSRSRRAAGQGQHCGADKALAPSRQGAGRRLQRFGPDRRGRRMVEIGAHRTHPVAMAAAASTGRLRYRSHPLQ